MGGLARAFDPRTARCDRGCTGDAVEVTGPSTGDVGFDLPTVATHRGTALAAYTIFLERCMATEVARSTDGITWTRAAPAPCELAAPVKNLNALCTSETVGDLVIALKDRIIGEPVLGADETAPLEALLGPLTAPASAVDAVVLRHYCGVLLGTPQFTFSGLPGRGGTVPLTPENARAPAVCARLEGVPIGDGKALACRAGELEVVAEQPARRAPVPQRADPRRLPMPEVDARRPYPYRR